MALLTKQIIIFDNGKSDKAKEGSIKLIKPGSDPLVFFNSAKKPLNDITFGIKCGIPQAIKVETVLKENSIRRVYELKK